MVGQLAPGYFNLWLRSMLKAWEPRELLTVFSAGLSDKSLRRLCNFVSTRNILVQFCSQGWVSRSLSRDVGSGDKEGVTGADRPVSTAIAGEGLWWYKRVNIRVLIQRCRSRRWFVGSEPREIWGNCGILQSPCQCSTLEKLHRWAIICAHMAHIVLAEGRKGRFWEEIWLAFKETSLYLEWKAHAWEARFARNIGYIETWEGEAIGINPL